MTWKGIVGLPFSPSGFESYVSTLRWGAWRPDFCVLHNTGIPTLANWHRVTGPARMRGLESYYRDDVKWSAGPHLFVADDYIWVFTALTTPGVHAPSWNAVSWGIETVGDWNTEPLSARVFGLTLAALSTLHRYGTLNPQTLKYHKEDPKTTHRICPGKNWPEKPLMVQALQKAIALGPFSDVSSGSSSTGKVYRPTLRRGSTGAHVAHLQKLLGMSATGQGVGIFGPQTEAAVRRFQRDSGLPEDGVAGPRFWATIEP